MIRRFGLLLGLLVLSTPALAGGKIAYITAHADGSRTVVYNQTTYVPTYHERLLPTYYGANRVGYIWGRVVTGNVPIIQTWTQEFPPYRPTK